MSEEKPLKCVFGYGECPVREMLAKESRDAEDLVTGDALRKAVIVKHGEKQAQELSVFMEAILTPISAMFRRLGNLRDVAGFCNACPKVKERSQ